MIKALKIYCFLLILVCLGTSFFSEEVQANISHITGGATTAICFLAGYVVFKNSKKRFNAFFGLIAFWWLAITYLFYIILHISPSSVVYFNSFPLHVLSSKSYDIATSMAALTSIFLLKDDKEDVGD